MRKIVLLMHVSLDGFVAGPLGEMNWIKADAQLFDFAKSFTDTADAALYGRKTYEMMEGYWPTAGDEPDASDHDKDHSKWVNNATKIVISKTMKSSDWKPNLIIGENLAERIREEKTKAGKDILMIGSPSTVHSFLDNSLIDEFRLFINPILLKEGIPLFKKLKQQVELKLIDTQKLDSGVVYTSYAKK